MRTSVRELRNHLGDYLRRVAGGEEIVITSHNRPIAKLSPVSEADAEAGASRQALVAELQALREDLKGKVKGKPMSQVVTQLRDEERY